MNLDNLVKIVKYLLMVQITVQISNLYGHQKTERERERELYVGICDPLDLNPNFTEFPVRFSNNSGREWDNCTKINLFGHLETRGPNPLARYSLIKNVLVLTTCWLLAKIDQYCLI